MKIGVLGAGSFGTAISKLISQNEDVLIYARNPDTIRKINVDRKLKGIDISGRITGTTRLQDLSLIHI